MKLTQDRNSDADYQKQSVGVDVPDEQRNRRWWMEPNALAAAQAIAANVDVLGPRHLARCQQLASYARLYGNMSLWGLAAFAGGSQRGQAVGRAESGRITDNIEASCVDTITAKMAKNKVKPYFLTSKGNWRTQRKGHKLNDFLDGIWDETKSDAMALESFRMCAIAGDGYIFVGERHGRICAEAASSAEVMVDEFEGLRRNPRQLFRIMLLDRSVASDLWPSKRGAIHDADKARTVATSSYPTTADLIEVVEAWHLRSSPTAKDGLHMLSVDGTPLTPMEDYPYDSFPCARMPWCPKPLGSGYYSQGLVEQLEGIQLELNKLMRLIQVSHDRGGSFRWLVHTTAGLVPEHLRPTVGGMLLWKGANRPEPIVAQHVPPEVYQQRRELHELAFQISGVSQLSAQSQKPAGLNSGKALRVYADMEADRFETVNTYWQNFNLDLGRLYIRQAKAIADANHGKYSVSTPGRRFLQSVDWRDINLEDDEYTLRCYPVSGFSDDPAQRLQDVQELAQAGIIPQRHVARLLNFPDLAQFQSLQEAQEDWITMVLDRLVEDGVYTAPDPIALSGDGFAMAVEMATQTYAEGLSNGLEEDRLDDLRTWLAQVLDQQAKAAPPPPAPMKPQAVPGAPPVSPLLPTMPQAA